MSEVGSTKNKTQNQTLAVDLIRLDFPILAEEIDGNRLVYLDNGATSQKPNAVINAITDYYKHSNSNVHRGAHTLSERATDAHEDARETAQHFLNAPSQRCINFTTGTTEGINLVASTYGRANLQPGDRILVTEMDHHSNIVPWQMIAQECGAKVVATKITEKGEIDLADFKQQVKGAKIASFSHVSNALGTINPIAEMIAIAHEARAIAVIDGAQAAPHLKINVAELDCDFYCISGHKMFAPTGTGILYGKEELLQEMPPYKGGGEMIQDVSFEGTTFNDLPFKFEAGTPNIAGSVGLAAAMKYIQKIGYERIHHYETELLSYAIQKLSAIDGLTIIGQAKKRAGVVSFILDGVHAYDLGILLNEMGIAIRTGNHCCQPLMHKLNIEGTCRASFAFYNTKEEVDQLCAAILTSRAILA